jgi:hypothetical protein
MNQTWIVFSIDDQQVYQIEYKGCTGQDTIDGYKSLIAGEYKTPEEKIKVSFRDDLNKPEAKVLKTRVTSSELLQDVRKALSQQASQN